MPISSVSATRTKNVGMSVFAARQEEGQVMDIEEEQALVSAPHFLSLFDVL